MNKDNELKLYKRIEELESENKRLKIKMSQGHRSECFTIETNDRCVCGTTETVKVRTVE